MSILRLRQLGRLMRVVKPGDTESIPTASYTYYDTEQPFKVRTQQPESSSCSNCIWPSFQFYDGLGRDLQVKSESVAGSQTIVVDKQ